MSTSTANINMLRTRRKDVSVKPNRRLDRKSSRGMIYENEELRLRTININAEIERGQSDIKKLRRENEQLRKEIWCLRDEYDKLEQVLKDKHSTSGSSSTCSSETESCSSCTESDDESTHNVEKVPQSAMGLRTDFDHLSIVTEETSAENSDRNSNRASAPKDVIQPDQSYPNDMAGEKTPKHFFSPISINTYNETTVPPETYPPFHDFVQNFQDAPATPQMQIGPAEQYSGPAVPAFIPPFQPTPYATPIFERKPLLTFGQASPPIMTSHLSKSSQSINLKPCDKTSSDVLVKTDNRVFSQSSDQSSFANGGNLNELLQDIETISQDILQISSGQKPKAEPDIVQRIQDGNATYIPNFKVDNLQPDNAENGYNFPDNIETLEEKPYKSELNVVLMPTPMPLLGFDKYRNLQSSSESIKKSTENMENGFAAPTILKENVITTEFLPTIPIPENVVLTDTVVPFNAFLHNGSHFETLHNSEVFNARYNPDNFNPENGTKIETKDQKPEPIYSVIKKTKPEEKTEDRKDDKPKPPEKPKRELPRSPRPRRTRKVSIYFKGKKDKIARSLSLDTKINKADAAKPDKSPAPEKKYEKLPLPKTPSTDSKIFESSNSDKIEKLTNGRCSSLDSKLHRKSSSVSPERKHVHVKVDDGKKCHKKHHKKGGNKSRRGSMQADRSRERSHSVCTDRSYDHHDYTNSERERTNSLSSCETLKSRKMSNISSFHMTGKIPWCGCWGNGCF